jgi:hypothetical protein
MSLVRLAAIVTLIFSGMGIISGGRVISHVTVTGRYFSEVAWDLMMGRKFAGKVVIV